MKYLDFEESMARYFNARLAPLFLVSFEDKGTEGWHERNATAGTLSDKE